MAQKSLNGIKPFSSATKDDVDKCILYIDEINHGNFHPIVRNSCVDEIHHDVIDVYGCDTKEYLIGVVEDEDGHFINIQFANYDEEIAIFNGKWYFT